MGSKAWVSFSRITFPLLHEEIAKHLIASSFRNIFSLVHDEVQDKAKTCTWYRRVHKITRCTTFP